MSNQPVTAEDLYLYAMHLLEPEEHARLDSFLQQSPEARAELARVLGDLASLALSAEAVAPSPVTRQRLLKQVSREKKMASITATVPIDARDAQGQEKDQAPIRVLKGSDATREENARQENAREDRPQPVPSFLHQDAPRRGFLSVVLPWAGWAIAAGLAVSTFDLYHRSEELQNRVVAANERAERSATDSARAQQVLETLRSGSAQRFQLTKQNTQPIPSARVAYLAESGSLVLQGSNLEQLPPNKTYELWLIPAGQGRQPIPAGTFKPDERGYASVILPQLPKGVSASTFGVTMEDDGGAQTPTLPILMIGS